MSPCSYCESLASYFNTFHHFQSKLSLSILQRSQLYHSHIFSWDVPPGCPLRLSWMPCKAALQLLMVGPCMAASIDLHRLSFCCHPVIIHNSSAALRLTDPLSRQSSANRCSQFKQASSFTVSELCRFNLTSSWITEHFRQSWSTCLAPTRVRLAALTPNHIDCAQRFILMKWTAACGGNSSWHIETQSNLEKGTILLLSLQ